MNTYRLPNESEWGGLAAGHMPKDADFNCGVKRRQNAGG